MREIQCATAGATYTNADNLVTITKWYTNGANLDRRCSIEKPDGTMQLFQYGFYTNGSGDIFRTNIVLTGAPDPAMSDATRGLQKKNSGADVARSVCPYCAVGCGQLVYHRGGRVVVDAAVRMEGGDHGREQTFIRAHGAQSRTPPSEIRCRRRAKGDGRCGDYPASGSPLESFGGS